MAIEILEKHLILALLKMFSLFGYKQPAQKKEAPSLQGLKILCVSNRQEENRRLLKWDSYTPTLRAEPSSFTLSGLLRLIITRGTIVLDLKWTVTPEHYARNRLLLNISGLLRFNISKEPSSSNLSGLLCCTLREEPSFST